MQQNTKSDLQEVPPSYTKLFQWHQDISETSPYKSNPRFDLTYSKNGGNLGLVLKMKNVACLSILLTKHVKFSYLYLFKFVLYSIVAFKAN